MSIGRAYFLDNLRNDVIKVATQLKQEGRNDLAFDLLQRYDVGTLNEAGGNTYKFRGLEPKINKDGSIKKGSGKIEAIRRNINELPVDVQIEDLLANIDGIDRLIASLKYSDQQLVNRLTPHNKQSIDYKDIVDILNQSADYNSVIKKGPGQVGSPVRQKGDKPFNKLEAVLNAAQFLTEPDYDRLLGGRVTYGAQGHTLDRVKYPQYARNTNLMRKQQFGSNWRDGAGESKLKNLTRKDVLLKGRAEYVNQLENMVNDLLTSNPQVYDENLLNKVMAAKYGYRKAGGELGIPPTTMRDLAMRAEQAQGQIVGQKPLVVNAPNSKVYVRTNGNGNANGMARVFSKSNGMS